MYIFQGTGEQVLPLFLCWFSVRWGVEWTHTTTAVYQYTEVKCIGLDIHVKKLLSIANYMGQLWLCTPSYCCGNQLTQWLIKSPLCGMPQCLLVTKTTISCGWKHSWKPVCVMNEAIWMMVVYFKSSNLPHYKLPPHCGIYRLLMQ